ncbi:MAG TPA: hypothetical protein VHJ82_01660 [Actinomycetota bacterium]|nr:hypothetical protein [Actinomycetota bacterium]
MRPPDPDTGGMVLRARRTQALLGQTPGDHASAPGALGRRRLSVNGARRPAKGFSNGPLEGAATGWADGAVNRTADGAVNGPGSGSDATTPDLGDVVIVLLVGTLSGLADRLATDGFDRAAGVVTDLVELADDYITQVVAR